MEAKDNKKILIVYYSWSGNTRAMAQLIHTTVGGDIEEIVPVNAYPSDYKKCVDQASKEIKAKYKPQLKPLAKDVAKYDVIFVGSPNWWSTMAPPVASFLASHNLKGKTIIPFVTHGGGGMANCAIDMKQLCKGATTIDGKAIYGDAVAQSKDEVVKWLKLLSFVK